MRFKFFSMCLAILALSFFSCKSDESFVAEVEEILLPEKFDFKKVHAIGGNSGVYYASTKMGFVGNEETDQLFHAINSGSATVTHFESIGSVNLTDGEEVWNSSPSTEGLDRRIAILNSEILVFTCFELNIYSSDLSIIENKNISKCFGSFNLAQDEDKLFALGNSYPNEDSADVIWKWEEDAQEFIEDKVMGEKIYRSACELVNGNLYIIGGASSHVEDLIGKNTIMVYNTAFKTFHPADRMPFNSRSTVTAKYKHLIFVAGLNYPTGDFTAPSRNFGVYNTLDGTFSEKEICLENFATGEYKISAMTVLKDKLYIVSNVSSGKAQIQEFNLQ